MNIAITGVGSCLPAHVINNSDIPGYHLADKTWKEFWGTNGRHTLLPNEELVELGVNAVRNAMEMANITPDSLDIMLVSSTNIAGQETEKSRALLPRLGFRIRNRIKAQNALALDIEAGCAGFLVSLEAALTHFASGKCKRLAIITVDAFSRVHDLTDPSGIIFGDGAGAVILEKLDNGYGYIHSRLATESAHYEITGVRWKLPRQGNGRYRPLLHLDSSIEMVDFLPSLIPRAIQRVSKEAGYNLEDIDMFVVNQPGRFLIDQWKRELNIPARKAPDFHQECACLSASAIPVTLDRIARAKKLKRGQLVMMAGFGVGWTWGAHLWKWN